MLHSNSGVKYIFLAISPASSELNITDGLHTIVCGDLLELMTFLQAGKAT